MKKTTWFTLLATFLSGLMLISCTKDLPPGEYNANETGKIKKVVPGVIVSKRAVNLQKKTTTNLSTSSQSNTGFVDNGYTKVRGVEYVIRLNSGSIISVVQNEDLKLKNKQKILVIYGKHTRVVADNGSDS